MLLNIILYAFSLHTYKAIADEDLTCEKAIFIGLEFT